MNFLINTFFIYLKKHQLKGIEASIYALTIVLIFNFLTFLNALDSFIELDIYNFIVKSVFALIFGFGINKYLEKKYLKEEKFSDLQLSSWFYLFPPIYYFSSIFLFVLSLRYT